MQYGKLEIDSFQLAGQCNGGLYFAFINGSIYFNIKPSKYKNVVIKRIKRELYNKAFFNV